MSGLTRKRIFPDLRMRGLVRRKPLAQLHPFAFGFPDAPTHHGLFGRRRRLPQPTPVFGDLVRQLIQPSPYHCMVTAIPSFGLRARAGRHNWHYSSAPRRRSVAAS
jgi:hypothetical protein